MTAKLAVCIPVHHGRAIPLEELLERLAPQISDQTPVEICVSDNASRDGTEDLVKGYIERLGADRVRYQRHEVDRGLTENLLAVVEMATADYCWLVGSDDAPTDRAVETILEAVSPAPGPSGASVGFFRRTDDDLEIAGADLNVLPSEAGDARLHSAAAFAAECSLLTLPLSCNVVNRERWRRVVAEERAAIDRTPIVPQVYITCRMVVRDPDWLWIERPCVLLREAEVFLAEEGQLGPDLGRQLRAVCADLDRAWTNAYGRRSALRLASLDRLWRFLWHPAALTPVKQMSAPGLGTDARFLSIARHFWRFREFRSQVLPLLLMPGSRMRLDDPGLDLRPRSTLASLRLEPVGELFAARGAWVRVEVTNDGHKALSYGPPAHLALFARWLGRDGSEVAARIGHTPIAPALRRGASRPVPVYLTVPAAAGEYELEVDLLSANRGWSATDGAPVRQRVRVAAPPD